MRLRAFFSFIAKFIRARGSISELYLWAQSDVAGLKNDVDQIRAHLRETDRDIFYTAAGQALTVWAGMEEELVVLVALLMPAMTEKAGLIMYSIINFNVWLTIIDELFNLEPKYSEFRSRWNKIGERLRKEKDNRDRLAHHPISQELKGKAFSRPPRLDTRQKSKSFVPLTVRQATEFGTRVASIAEDLLKLTYDMADHLERSASQKKSGELSRDQST